MSRGRLTRDGLAAFLSLWLATGCTPEPEAGGKPAASGPMAESRPSDTRPTGRPAASVAHASDPDIIVILTDDQAPDTLGVEGNPVIRTPHIDRLAREGVRFSRAYVAIPQCAPSRASILTGRYPHQTGVLDNDDAVLPEGAVTLAHVLGRSGYRCGLVGKWHLGAAARPRSGFGDWWVEADIRSVPRDGRFQRQVVDWNGTPRTIDRYLTDVEADAALEFIGQPDPRPYFLWLAFHAPHTPLVPHPDFKYDHRLIAEPPSMKDDLRGKPADQRGFLRAGFERWGWNRIRRERAIYYSMISGVDAAVGRILAQLDSTGRARDTLIVFCSDNGFLLGEHGLYKKGAAFYEHLTRTPLIVWRPGSAPAGQVRTTVVTLLDLFPTLANQAGAEVPDGLAGRDLWPVIIGAAAEVSEPDGRQRTAVFLEYLRKDGSDESPMLGVVTGRFKYNRYLVSGAEECYDLASDPHELNNLAAQREWSVEGAALRARLDDFQNSIQPRYWD